MIRKNTTAVLLVFVTVVIAGFMISGKYNSGFLYITSYTALILGLSLFYSSYLKQNKTLIVLGSIIFLFGSVLFVFVEYEILGFGNIFMPTALFILGASVLIANLITKVNSVSIVFSFLSILAGIWLIIQRGSSKFDLFLASIGGLVRNYWIILLVGAGIIFFLTKMFKKEN